jgi:hypothetical protein
MYANSIAETRGCLSGSSYSHTQNATQMNPTAPVAINAPCHPHRDASHGTIIGHVTAPTVLPALNSPVARARSCTGNHSATVLTAAGNLPPSVRPSQARATLNPVTVRAAACPIAARLQKATDDKSPRRTPTRSINRPADAYPIA